MEVTAPTDHEEEDPMNENILSTALDFIMAQENVNDPATYGTNTVTGLVYDKEAELTTTYVRGAGFIEGTVGETKIVIAFDDAINKHSFKLSVGGKPEFIADRDEILLIARDCL